MERTSRALLVAAALAAGCTSPRTEIVLGVATDLSATDEIDKVQLLALRDGVTVVQNEWDISGLPAKPTELPGSFGVYSTDGTEPRVEVEVTALHSGAIVVQRRALFSLVKEQTLFMRIGLTSPCTAMTCGAGQTCVEGACRPEAIDATTLPQYVAGMEASVQCSSGGVVYKNTSTKQPMPISGSGACLPGQTCTEGTCYGQPTPPDMAMGGPDMGSGAPTVVASYAGSGVPADLDGPNGTAGFYLPAGVAADPTGVLFVTEESDYVRKVTATTTTTLAGNGMPGSTNGAGMQAQFNQPAGVASDVAGGLFIADIGNRVIRRIDGAGNVTTFSGNGTIGNMDGPAASAQFSGPTGLAYDPSNQMLYVTDTSNQEIRAVDPSGAVVTLAGTGIAGSADGSPGSMATFNNPVGVAYSVDLGKLLVVDQLGCKVREVSIVDGTTTTLAGNGACTYAEGTGGPGGTASFASPYGVAVDHRFAYVSDLNAYRIARVRLADGTTTTLAGDGTPAYKDGLPLQSEFAGPLGLALFANTLFVADAGSFRIRAVKLVEDLTGPWTPSMDQGQSGPIPTVTVTSSDAQHVSVSSVGGDGSTCGCNAQKLTIPLGAPLPCATGSIQFDYHTEGSFGNTSTSSVQIDLLSGGSRVGFYQGSEQTGHSNCAPFFGNNFPSPPALVEGHNLLVPGGLTPATNGMACTGSFDAVELHLQAYGCFTADMSQSTVSNFGVF